MKEIILVLTLLSATLLAAGCSSDEACSVVSSRSISADNSEAPSLSNGFGAEITLCRKVSRKSGRPIGESDQFKITTKSYVNAIVDFTEVQAGRTHVVHLVWVRPDGKELFRKYAEVVQSENSSEGFQTVITWLNAEDLHKVKRDTLFSEAPELSINTRFNISSKREREPGQYFFQVYLDRRFLLEKGFMVVGAEENEI